MNSLKKHLSQQSSLKLQDQIEPYIDIQKPCTPTQKSRPINLDLPKQNIPKMINDNPNIARQFVRMKQKAHRKLTHCQTDRSLTKCSPNDIVKLKLQKFFP